MLRVVFTPAYRTRDLAASREQAAQRPGVSFDARRIDDEVGEAAVPLCHSSYRLVDFTQRRYAMLDHRHVQCTGGGHGLPGLPLPGREQRSEANTSELQSH